MNKTKRVLVTLLVLIMSAFASVTMLGCGEETPEIIDLSQTATVTVADVTYGSTPVAVVKNGETTLVEGTDYDVTYGDYSTVKADVKATVTFKGLYSGTVGATFDVTAFNAAAKATFSVADIEYGSTPTATVTLEGFTLVAGTDYDVTFGDYSALATGVEAKVTFKGNFAGEKTATFSVVPKAITPQITVTDENLEYTGEAIEPAIIVKDGNGDEIPANLYDIDYRNNVFAGEGKVTVTLKGIYSGSAEKTFAIAKKKIAKPAADETEFIYNGNVQEYEIADSNYYEVAGNLQSEKGEYEVTVLLIDGDNCEWADGTLADLTYEFNIAAYNVSGKAVVTVADIVEGEDAEVQVELPNFTLEETDYAVNKTDNGNGSMTATVTFNGNFTGTASANYTVKSLAENIEVYMDFNYDITDRANAHATSMQGEDPVESYSAANSNTGAINLTAGRKRFVKVENAPLGTDDFMVSLNVKFDMADIAKGTNEGNAIFETGLHVPYDCNGNCGTKGCPSTHKDVVKLALCYDNSTTTTYKLRYQFGHNDVNAYGINHTLTAEQLAQIVENGEGKWFNVTFGVDRKVAVDGDIEKAIGYLYLNGVLINSREVEYDIDGGNYYVLGDGNIYLGGNNTWTSGGGVKYRDRSIDNFVLYKGVLNEKQVSENLPAYIASNDVKTDWTANDVDFDFFDVDAFSGTAAYEAALTLSGTTAKDGITLKNAPAGVSLTENSGAYKLVFTADGLNSVKNGAKLTLTRGGIDKSINVCYTPLEAIYVSNDISFYDLAVTASGITKQFKVTADENGTIGLAGVTFKVNGVAYANVTAGANAGDYVLTLTEAEAKAITADVVVTASYEDLTDTLTIKKIAFSSLVAASFSKPNGTGMTNDVAGSAVTLNVSAQRYNTSKAAVNNPTYATAVGADGDAAGGLKLYAYDNYYELQNFTGHQDNVFTYSLDINIQGLGTNEQACALFATEGGGGSATNGIHVGAAINSSGKLVFRMHANGKGGAQKITIDNASAYTGKYVNLAFVFTVKSSTVYHVDVYIDGVKKGEKDLAVTEGYKLAQTADDNYVGIGGVYGSTADTSVQDNNKNKIQYIDNIVLFNNALTAEEVALIAEYNKIANANANA